MSIYINKAQIVSREKALEKILGSPRAAKAYLWCAASIIEAGFDITIIGDVPIVLPREISCQTDITNVTHAALEAAWWASPSPKVIQLQHCALQLLSLQLVWREAA